MSNKLDAGGPMPEMTLNTAGGGQAQIGGKRSGWQAVFVYRGLHCPICKTYLGKLEAMKDKFAALDTEIVTVSGDPKDKADKFAEEVGLTLPVAYDLSVAQMKELGLYISTPRSDAETDRPFPEPGLFIVSPEGKAHIVEIANAPFVRPDLDLIVRGLDRARDGYPTRGTMPA
jgi:peroxiredoxin